MGWETYEPPEPESEGNPHLGLMLLLVVFVSIFFIELALI